jgi:hypothetical protein
MRIIEQWVHLAHNFRELQHVRYRAILLKEGACLEELRDRRSDAHVRFDFGSRKIDFRRWLRGRLEGLRFLLVHLRRLLALWDYIGLLPFFRPLVQGSKGIDGLVPWKIFFMAVRNKLQKFDLLLGIKMRS